MLFAVPKSAVSGGGVEVTGAAGSEALEAAELLALLEIGADELDGMSRVTRFDRSSPRGTENAVARE
jgi:hypothetical protein